MEIKYPTIGVCGLSCRLCPSFHRESASRCEGCKSAGRMVVGCPFITCAVKKKGVEFCWQCDESETCERWKHHRELGKEHDSFKCYQSLENDIALVLRCGVEKLDADHKAREALLRQMLDEFNDGRSKSYYCIAAAIMGKDELVGALEKARSLSGDQDMKKRAAILHSLLDDIAERKGYVLKLRK